MKYMMGWFVVGSLVSVALVSAQEPDSRPTSQPTGGVAAVDPVEDRAPFDLDKAQDQVDAGVSAAELAAHIKYLASDELEGRYTGSAGGKLAADYLARTLAQLEVYGLQPGGDDGTYLQDIQLKNVSYAGLPVLMADSGSGFVDQVYGSDFALVAGLSRNVDLDVLRVDDVEDARLGSPDGLKALYLDMSKPAHRDLLAEKGAAWQAGWGALVLKGSMRKRTEVKSPARIRGIKVSLDGVELPLTIEVHGALRDSFGDGLVTRISLEAHGVQAHAYNVVALLPSTVAKAKMSPGMRMPTEIGGAIVLSAHYDHLRPRPRKDGDAADVDLIYNGADDDASGVAAVLEIIEALAFQEHRERDIVVLLATGEEIGLVGTSYYLDHPVIALDQTLCNLNFEMIGRPDDAGGGFGKLWLTGYDYTGVGPAMAANGIAVVRDPHPEQNYFRRSDNYAFVLKGIIGQSFSSYNGHEDYHHVSDEADTIDYWHMEAAVADCARAIIMALDFGFKVEWVEGYTPPRK